jgi:hypothetical protein
MAETSRKHSKVEPWMIAASEEIRQLCLREFPYRLRGKGLRSRGAGHEEESYGCVRQLRCCACD